MSILVLHYPLIVLPSFQQTLQISCAQLRAQLPTQAGANHPLIQEMTLQLEAQQLHTLFVTFLLLWGEKEAVGQ